MKNTKMLEIEVEKLRSALEKRGKSFQQASEEIGHSKGYLRMCTKEGRLAMHAVKALQAIYNIHPEEYAVSEDGGGVNEEELRFSLYALRMLLQRTKPEELKELIKEAVKEAFQEI